MKHTPLIFEYSKITNYIYIGTNMCCQQSYFNKNLLKMGIKADISLEETRIDQPFGIDSYLWLPTKDHKAPTLKQLKIGVTFLKELKKQKVKCYIHCQRGHGRAPTLVAAYLVSEGMEIEKAINFIRKRRLAIHPNKSQIKALENFWKRL